jgi:hypothetical protein
MRRMTATPTIKKALPMMNMAWIPRTEATGPTIA